MPVAGAAIGFADLAQQSQIGALGEQVFLATWVEVGVFVGEGKTFVVNFKRSQADAGGHVALLIQFFLIEIGISLQDGNAPPFA